MKRLMALIDFSEVTPMVIKTARELALALKCELLLSHVLVPKSDLDESDTIESASPTGDERSHQRQMDVLKLALSKEGINAIAVVVIAKHAGSPVNAILAEVVRHAPDLIVMGTHGHGRLHHLFAGSVTETLLRRVSCPVVVPSTRGTLQPT